jgi:arylsulfatase A-like enzyme
MKRKEFLKAAAGLASSLPAFTSCGSPVIQSKKDSRPNIIIIMADDMGYSDIGCYGGEIDTPNIDRLARGGVRFTQFYNAARCCPTRASLLTGLYPHQAGMGDMVSAGSKGKPGPYQGYLNHSCVTIAEVLRQAGYSTYMSGKWHVGEAPEIWPGKRGFDRYFGLISGASSYYELIQGQNRRRTMALDDTEWNPPEEGFYMTDAFSERAVKYIDRHYKEPGQDKPFFLYLAYTAPHWPLHALPGDIAKYEGKFMEGWDVLRVRRYERMVKMGLIDPAWPLSPRDQEVPGWESIEDKEHWGRLMAVYAAMVDRMDQGIGRVLDKLKEFGAEQNTLVLFLSDNGGCHENIEYRKLNKPGTTPGERGSYVAYRRPWANLSNTPFRLFKHWVHEGGIATPLVACWPAAIRQGGIITHQPGHITDLMATATDVGKAEYPAEFNGHAITPPEGRSLMPVLRGGTRPERALYWEHEKNRAMRRGRWKLVSAGNGRWELYDLEADRTEMNNLAADNPELLEEMTRMYETWASRCGVKP